jgi:hypothetical protein
MLTIATVFFAVQIAVQATPLAQEQGRIDIPLSRRSALPADVVNRQVLDDTLTLAIL